MHPAFEGVGTSEGLEIWRIEVRNVYVLNILFIFSQISLKTRSQI